MTFLPIVERELRLTSRKAGTYWLRTLAALGSMVVVLFIIAIESRFAQPAMVANSMFSSLGNLAMVACLLAGVFLTSDCLSTEKRDGTAGLLFLTDLKGYDVVLGKLAASSLQACYGLVSILPVLALPLLMGGVTVGEFWRMVLYLMGALFFSLSMGMAVSSVSRESRQAMGGTLAVVLMLTAVLPAVHFLCTTVFTTGRIPALLWPSPGYAYATVRDAVYRYRGGVREYWGSLGTITGIGLVCLAAASLILPRAWQEKSVKARTGDDESWWRKFRYGTRRKREKAREWLLPIEPFQWLAMRDRLPSIGAWVIAGAASALLAPFVISAMNRTGVTRMSIDQVAIFITMGACLVFKSAVATEASRRLHDDRRSGALELLLVTPLSVEDIIRGQQRALRSQFRLPMTALMALYVWLLWLTFVTNGAMFPGRGFPLVLFLGNVVVLAADTHAMGWVAMWNGLRAGQHYRAVLASLAEVLVPPWIAYFVAGFVFFGGRGTSETEMLFFFACWFGFGVLNDWFWARRARQALGEFMRFCASGLDVGIRPTQRRLPPPPWDLRGQRVPPAASGFE